MYYISSEINGIENDLKEKYKDKREAVEAALAITSGLFGLADYTISVWREFDYSSPDKVFEIQNWEM